jgi:bacterioferritin-associated ferredoxin
MIVCLCRGVSERTVRLTVVVGNDSVEAVGDACGAGTGCGACLDDLQRIVDQERQNAAACRSAVLALGCQPAATMAKAGTSGR